MPVPPNLPTTWVSGNTITSASYDDIATGVNASWRATSNVYNVRAYGGLIDGATDDTAAWNAATLAAHNAGGGIVQCAPSTTSRRSVISAQIDFWPFVTIDGGGVELFRKASSAAAVGMIATPASLTPVNFGTSTRPGTQNTGSISATLRNIELNGNKANQSNISHNLAIYGAACKFEHIKSHDALGQDWFDYHATSQADLGTLGVGTGDHWHVIEDFESFNHSASVFAPATENFTVVSDITAIAAGANPLITTKEVHHLTAGNSVVIANVVGAVECNGTWTVLAAPSSTTFTITLAAHTAYTSGGTVAYAHAVAAFFTLLGPQNTVVNNGKTFNTGSVIIGQRGVLIGSDAAGASFTKYHVFQNFDVGVDNHCTNAWYQNGYVGGMNIQCVDRAPSSNWSGTWIQTSFSNGVGLYCASSGAVYVGMHIEQLGANAIYVQTLNGGFMVGSNFGIRCYDGVASGKWLFTPQGISSTAFGYIINADTSNITLGGTGGTGGSYRSIGSG